MADVTKEESYSSDSHRSYHRRDRTDRRNRANRLGEHLDGSSSSTDYRSPGLDDSGVANDLTGSADRESARRDRRERERRKPKDEAEINANDEAPVEGATAASEETSPKKSLKKEKKSENSARKRQQKKGLREKRRSTGVVMMPTDGGVDGEGEDETAKQVNANTAMNENLAPGDDDELEDTSRTGPGNRRIDRKVQKDSETIQVQQMREKIDTYEDQLKDYRTQLDNVRKQKDRYEEQLEETRSELDKVTKELQQLQVECKKLKEDNSSLVRIIGSLSTTVKK